MRNDALRVVSELAASQHNVFTTAQAASTGITRRALTQLIHSGLLSEPFPGAFVITPTGVASWSERARAASIAAAPASLSHRGAARHHALDGWTSEPTLDVSVVAPRRVRLDGLVAHRVKALDRCDIQIVDGMAVTNIARTLCDLGAVAHDPLTVEQAFDDAIRRDANPRWIRETARRLHHPGRGGTGLILKLLGDLERRGVVRDSWFEKLIELCLDDPALGEVTRQHRLCNADGRVIARFDLAIASVRLGIEGHSRKHHFGRAAEESDERRDNEAAKLGWDVMYVGYGDLRSPKTVHSDVQERVRVRQTELRRPAG